MSNVLSHGGPCRVDITEQRVPRNLYASTAAPRSRYF